MKPLKSLESLIINRQHLLHRSQLQRELRDWLHKQGFMEMTTPVILPHSSLEENIKPLRIDCQDHHQNSQSKFLRVSPELSLKKILATGLSKVYELGPCFRDQENPQSSQHLHEFNLLEWYHFGIEMQEMMREFIHLVSHLTTTLYGQSQLEYQGGKYNLGIEQSQHHWNILSVSQAFLNYAHIDFSQWESWEEIIPTAQKKGFQTKKIDDAFYWLFLNHVEPKIRNSPTIIYVYPIFQSSFSQCVHRPNYKNPRGLEYGLRFEAYLGGMEICNAFQELLDPQEQRKRWQSYLNNHPHDGLSMDEEFLEALSRLSKLQTKNVKPVLSGIAVGWERLLMFLLNEENIRNIQPLS